MIAPMTLAMTPPHIARVIPVESVEMGHQHTQNRFLEMQELSLVPDVLIITVSALAKVYWIIVEVPEKKDPKLKHLSKTLNTKSQPTPSSVRTLTA